jgi:hypothetical protein
MHKIIEHEQTQSVVEMADMLPGQIGRVISKVYCKDHIVFRTLNLHHFEVIDLTEFSLGGYWDGGSSLKVLLLPPGEKVIVEFSNE